MVPIQFSLCASCARTLAALASRHADRRKRQQASPVASQRPLGVRVAGVSRVLGRNGTTRLRRVGATHAVDAGMLTEAQINAVIANILDEEGGYTDNPADAGGATNFGITQATANDYGLGDVRNLTRDQAAAAYVRILHDWRIDTIPDFNVFELTADSCVAHGPGNGIKWLQMALGCTPDGSIGPQTQSKMNLIPSWRVIYYSILALRTQFYGIIINKNHSQSVFAEGWLNRLATFISPAPTWTP